MPVRAEELGSVDVIEKFNCQNKLLNTSFTEETPSTFILVLDFLNRFRLDCGTIICLNPKASVSATRLSSFATDRTSPTRPTSPTNTVLGDNDVFCTRSKRRDYRKICCWITDTKTANQIYKYILCTHYHP